MPQLENYFFNIDHRIKINKNRLSFFETLAEATTPSLLVAHDDEDEKSKKNQKKNPRNESEGFCFLFLSNKNKTYANRVFY